MHVPAAGRAGRNTLLISPEELKIENWKEGATFSMPATGELIRMMNYVDDIAATLRRIHVGISTMTPEERKRLADYMRNSDPNFTTTLESLDKG
jgi:hypothetical protein